MPSNAIAGSSHYHGTFSGGAWWYYAYALEQYSKIDINDNWESYYHQIMALVTIDSEDGFIDIAPNAHWFNLEINETINHFLGIRFIDSDTLDHYGWIRCDVIDSGKTLILKDYAYSVNAEDGIYAGTYVSYMSVLLEKNWHIYTYNNELTIRSEKDLPRDTKLNIYNSHGSLIFTTSLINNYSSFDLHGYSPGVYLVEVKNVHDRVVQEIHVL